MRSIYQRQARLHFAIFGLLGLYFLLFWHFGPSFPFIFAFWALLSFHFGILGLVFLSFWHFLSFWLFGGQLLAPPPQVAKNGPLSQYPIQRIYQRQARLHFASFPFFLAFWAFISFHFGLLGLDFLSFWPFGPSFPFILAF